MHFRGMLTLVVGLCLSCSSAEFGGSSKRQGLSSSSNAAGKKDNGSKVDGSSNNAYPDNIEKEYIADQTGTVEEFKELEDIALGFLSSTIATIMTNSVFKVAKKLSKGALSEVSAGFSQISDAPRPDVVASSCSLL